MRLGTDGGGREDKPFGKNTNERNNCKYMQRRKKSYKKDTVDKWKDPPKLFYKHINVKLRVKQDEGMEWIKVNGIRYNDVTDILLTFWKYLQGKVNLVGQKKLKKG